MARRVAHTDPAMGSPAANPPPSVEGNAAGTTRERILDVALDLFVRKGYAETSLREIAAEMGFSKAAIYYHFESKQDILLALHMRLHTLTEGVLPLLQAEVDTGDTWERFVDLLIGIALQNRRLLEFHLRNQEAIAALHYGAALAKHAQVAEQHDVQEYVFALLKNPSLPVEGRVRRMASLGAVVGVLLTASAFADVPDAELEATLRGVIHDLLRGRKRPGPEGTMAAGKRDPVRGAGTW